MYNQGTLFRILCTRQITVQHNFSVVGYFSGYKYTHLT